MKDLKKLINEIPDYIGDLSNVDSFMKNNLSAKLKANKTTIAINSSLNGNSRMSTNRHEKNLNNAKKLIVSENKFQQSANRSNENNINLKEENRIFEGGEEFQSGIVNKSNDSNMPTNEHKNYLQAYLSKFAKGIYRSKQKQMKKLEQNVKKLEQKNENKELNKLLQNQETNSEDHLGNSEDHLGNSEDHLGGYDELKETNSEDHLGGYDELKEKHANDFLRFTPDFHFYKNNSNDNIHNFLRVRPTETEEGDVYTTKREGYLESKLNKVNPHNYIRPYMTPAPTKSMMGKRTPTIPLLDVDDNWTQSTLKNPFNIFRHYLRNRVTLNCRNDKSTWRFA